MENLWCIIVRNRAVKIPALLILTKIYSSKKKRIAMRRSVGLCKTERLTHILWVHFRFTNIK